MKFKIRKAIALAAVAALALTGCSSKGGGSDTTGENGKTRIVVDMWAGGQKDTDALKKQVEIAQKALPDIQIELRTAPWGDFFTKLTTNMGTDNMACVTGMNSGKLTDYKSGFAELTEADLATAGLKSSDFAKDATQILSNGGTMYGLPFDMATMLVYHNADMISSTGAPQPKNGWTFDDFEATAAAGASGQAARKWWMGELARAAKDRGIALEELAVSPAQVAQLQGLVDSGRLTDKLARQVLDGVLAGEGGPSAVVEARGLEVVSDDSALLAAVDEALAAQPDVAEKIRGGKVKAAGAIVGAVMKATRGQADARRVRELVMERVAR